MKRFFLTSAAVALCVSNADFAEAQSPAGQFYLQLDGGGSFFQDNDAVGGGDISYDPGYVIGGRLGFRPTASFRTELDVSYSDNEVDEVGNLDLTGIDVDVTTLNVTVAAYGDFLAQGMFAPYAGGGIGAAFWEASAEALGVEVEEDETDLTAFGELGVALTVTPHISIVPHYRLVWIDGIGDDEQFAHWLRLGLRLSQ